MHQVTNAQNVTIQYNINVNTCTMQKLICEQHSCQDVLFGGENLECEVVCCLTEMVGCVL